ncbi:chemotaxis protein CheD [Alicyclobacillus tolerans]|uniref:chemotaxis protein CheD n=1 Tax=Alicyclobacillus tolerans TaxID=90970 RepID=UPI001F366A15|nr:chemotaxis protein CheD [Alicyclobacillus tolerans]MCF8564777.1 chemotaxis protein CheD [Alicyclobacillus tolerans]
MIEDWGSVEFVRIGIAEGAVVRAPVRLKTTGLGSCVGVVVYDGAAGLLGMAHIMLPTAPARGEHSHTKYANLAVPWLIRRLLAEGGQKARFRAKIAGGAQMFASSGGSEVLRVGPRNVEAVREALMAASVPLVAQDVGGNVGRTIEFDLLAETLWIRTAHKGVYQI